MKRTKKALAVVLSLSMLASITPQIVLANSNIPDRYEEVSEMQAIVKDAEVHAYVTRNGGTAELTDSNGVETTFTQGIGYREYTATPADGWVWKGWTYEQLYQGEDLGNRTDYGWGKRYSFSNDGSDWNSAYNGTLKMVQELDKMNHTTIMDDMLEHTELKDKHRHLLELEKTTIEERIDTAVSKETDGIF